MALAFDGAFLDDRSGAETAAPGAGEPRRRRPALRIIGSAAAMDLDRRLLALSGRAARCRFVEGRVAAPLLARRGWTALGFARLTDYSRERLGISVRSIEENVRVATALEATPRIAAAFLDGTLSWTATKLVAGIATPRDEAEWIEKARSMDARALEPPVRQARAPEQASRDPASVESGGETGEAESDDPRVRWSVRVSSLGWRVWRAACELAERTAGGKLTAARVLELVAAEASGSVAPASGDDVPRSLDPAMRDLLDKLRSAGDVRSAAAETGADEHGSGESGIGSALAGGNDVPTHGLAAHDSAVDPDAFQAAPTDDTNSKGDGSRNEHGSPVGEGQPIRSGSDWREGLESRDPELAAFLAKVEREDAAARERSTRGSDESVSNRPLDKQESSAVGSGDTSSAEHRPYDWREGLAERDPQLAAFLAACEAEDAAWAAAAATMQDGDATTLERGDSATPERGNAARQKCGEAAGPPPDAPPPFASILREVAAREDLPWLVPPVPADATGPSAWLERHLHAIESADPFVIDERLREVRSRVHRLDFDLASLLREAARIRLYRDFDFTNLESYVESRLGICARTAWTLLAIERACSHTSPRLAEAWRDGRIHTMAAHAILRVLGRGHDDDDWIARAGAVMLRRLEDEVDWARARLAEGRTAEPPPEGLDLTGTRLAGVTIEELQMRVRSAQPAEATGPSEPTDAGELQMRAHGTHPGEATASSEPADAEELQMRAREAPAQTEAAADDPGFAASEQITFFAPKSVCTLATETMLALRSGSEPRGRTFERMLAAMLEWMAAPRHRDPVFKRDGWRCSVPGCTSRRNLHDHHIVFRSHGGDNARDNRITVCAAHHLHGLHRGRIRAYGRAPGEVTWEIGIRFGPGHGGKPLFRTVGDRHADPEGD